MSARQTTFSPSNSLNLSAVLAFQSSHKQSGNWTFSVLFTTMSTMSDSDEFEDRKSSHAQEQQDNVSEIETTQERKTEDNSTLDDRDTWRHFEAIKCANSLCGLKSPPSRDLVAGRREKKDNAGHWCVEFNVHNRQ